MSTLVLATTSNPGAATWTDSSLIPSSSEFMSAATLVDRDAIPTSLRSDGMWVSVAETGVVYYLNGGITNADWAVVDLGQPLSDTSATTDFYVDQASGSDINGTGTALAPFQTIIRAIQNIGSVGYAGAPTTRVINIVGTVDLPGAVNGLSLVEFRGAAATTTLTATIASVTSATDAAGIVLNVTGVTGATLNSLKGTPIRWSSGPANGALGWIYRNDATDTYVAGQTRIYVSQNSQGAILAPLTGNTIEFQSYPSSIRLPVGNAVISNCFGCNFTGLNVISTGAGVLSATGTGQVQFINCKMITNVKINPGAFGRVFLWNTYVQTAVTSGGMFAVGAGGIGQVGWGTVFDGTLTASNFITAGYAKLLFLGQTVFTGMNNIRIDGSDMDFGFATTAFQPHESFFFDSTTGGIVINSSVGLARGGAGALPNLYGTVASNYAVTAQGGANFKLGASSSVTSALGVNYVSADNGTTNIAEAVDGTILQGGSPSIGLNWTSVTYTNNWVTAGAGGAAYARDEARGLVYLRGTISTGAIGSSPFTLPARFRPAVGPLAFAVATDASFGTFGSVTVATNGVVTVAAGNNAAVALNGIVFAV